MSTLPGLASKGEKGKSKYQSLDINNLYKVYIGEPLETQQQKNTLPRKHGMQSLGKVPTARRPPANLPSLKSEHTGSDAAVSLVPSGGAGWGKQEPNPNSPTTTTSPSTSVTSTNTSNSSPAPVPSNLQTTTTPSALVPPPASKPSTTPSASPAVVGDKSWSAVMSSGGAAPEPHPPPYHSPQFQHEFPSLAGGEGAGGQRPGSTPAPGDAQYGPGPSLRPQTEGSWMQGGSRGGAEPTPKGGNGGAPGTGNSVAPGAPQPPSVQAGHPQSIQQHFRGLISPFMYKGNFGANGSPNFPSIPGTVNNVRGRGPDGKSSARSDMEDPPLLHRPIIKEEDLNRMDDMTRDVGWASHDDIDYNQKLAFSDDENDKEKDHQKSLDSGQDPQNKHWNVNKPTAAQSANRNRNAEEHDIMWSERRRQHSEQIAMAVLKAKQRKDEEEKRFVESKQAAAKKLQELEEKLSKKRENDENQGTINPSLVPPQTVTPTSIPVPDWDKDSRARTTPDNNKVQQQESSSDFRKLTQIEGRNFVRKETRSVERDPREREQTAPSFSKQFQSNLPPRFQKQQQMRNTSGPGSQSQSLTFSDQYDMRWQQNQFGKPGARKNKSESDEFDFKEEDDARRNATEDSYHSYRSYETKNEDNRDVKSQDRNDDKWEKEKRNIHDKFDEHVSLKHVIEKVEDKYQDRHERPDSRDSRISRDSESRDYHSSWAESTFDLYDDRRKDHHHHHHHHFKEDRRAVPGPITKERVEAEDIKSEKKNLIQLKRGYAQEKKSSELKKERSELASAAVDKKESAEKNVLSAWVDSISNVRESDSDKGKSGNEGSHEDVKPDQEQSEKAHEKDKEDKRNHALNRRRGESSRSNWNGAYVYRNSWAKKNDPRRGSKPPGKKSGKGEFHTDSDLSADEISVSTEGGKDERALRAPHRSPKVHKKSEKDERNKESRHERSSNAERKTESNRRENYVPRGEPSRHGRGAGNFRTRGGLTTKRIDGYGPPPSKSPFGQHEDRKTGDDFGSEVTSSDEKAKHSAPISGSLGNARSKDGGSKQNSEEKIDSMKGRNSVNPKLKGKSKSEDGTGVAENCDTSDNSEESALKDKKLKSNAKGIGAASGRGMSGGSSRHTAPRFGNDKRSYTSSRQENSNHRQNSSGSLKSYGSIKKDQPKEVDGEADKNSGVCDSDGFQEVKSKKTTVRQKSSDEKPGGLKSGKSEKDLKMDSKKSMAPKITWTPQQIANIPSLMDTPISPPPLVPQSKHQFDRPRINEVPPRFAKQRENRLQKAQLQQGMCDVNDMNKVNHNVNMYGLKDNANNSSVSIANAWEKPLSQLRNDQDMLSVKIDGSKSAEQVQSASQGNSPNIDKVIKSNHISEKTVLDGTTPPVNTIIFENTSFKTAPARATRPDKCNKLDDSSIDNSVICNFNKPIHDLLNKNDKSESIQMQLGFGKEDSADMKLDFFESEISHLTEDKNSKNLGLARSMHSITSVNSTISPSTADALNIKIASVKKVWETTMPTVVENSVNQDDGTSFSSSFGPDPNSLDPTNAFNKGADPTDDGHEGYSPLPNQTSSNNSNTNVCKVKPTQQVSNSSNQAVHAVATHQQPHSALVGPGIVGHPLSPPPLQPVLGGVGLGQPPQQYTSSQHLGYQPNLGGSTQYGIPAIPSPPTTVLFNSTQPMQAQTGLYGAFQIDQSQVMGGQGRSQYSQYSNHYGLGQTAPSPYSAQSMYMQSAQPHPQTAQAPPDIYQNINSYRLPANGPFGQNQQINNPTTMLISSTSNSLMSATVKPTTQQISAIGTKAGGAGQAYQQQSQQGQLYMTYDPSALQANYLQRGPAAPMQNNVVPGLQPSSSYYTGSTGAQTGFFQQPGNSTLPSAALQQHQAGYGLQGNVFGNPSQSHTSAGLQNFGSHFLSSPMQIAAALNAQQYRSQNMPNTAYVKGVTSQHIGDQNCRSQQLKSPSSQQDMLSSVFNSAPQISSPKTRQNSKQPPPQPSPTAQQKYNLYQGVGNQQSAQQRYPAPIQRPVNFQSTVGSGQNNSNRHRTTNQNNKLPSRHYYGGQGSNLNAQNEKKEETKLGETIGTTASNAVVISSSSSIASKAVISNSSSVSTNQTAELKENKEESSAVKD